MSGYHYYGKGLPPSMRLKSLESGFESLSGRLTELEQRVQKLEETSRKLQSPRAKTRMRAAKASKGNLTLNDLRRLLEQIPGMKEAIEAECLVRKCRSTNS